SPSRAFLRALPFGLAFPTLSDSFVSDSRSKRVKLFAFQRFQPYQIDFVPFPVRIRIPVAVEVALPFG
ncbi:hypothetical protein ACIOEZ_35280, partial [Streptomyces sp. NPDC087866]|uniref:hypothetical protein n=1 Tax=Streptomyces sp. NPDC087866 TaxID=3365815 RepID=UPI003810CB35